MHVKFCGMTNLEDVLASLDLGVDFIGFVFYKKSPRYIKAQDVKEIIQKIPKQTNSVGVFVEE
ncbi:MAG: phosphoribosylanthranilate isomerase, partial [Desulfurella sp.]